MAYAAVTSLMETLSLHFLQSEPGLPLEDLEAQIIDGNENLGLLQQIIEIGNDDAGAMKYAEAKMRLDEASSSKGVHGIFNYEAVKQTDYYPNKKKLIKSEKLQQLADLEAQIRDAKYENLGVLKQILEARIREMELDEEASSKQHLAWDTILLTSRLREMAELKQKIVSLHQNLGLLQQSLEKSEIACNDARVRVMKDLEAQIRDASFKLEERIEMELSAIYLAKDSRLHLTACLLRLHQIFHEAQKQTDYHMNELIRIQTHEYQLAKVSLPDEKLPRKSQHLFSKPCRWLSDASECLNNQIRSGDKRFDKSHSLHSRCDYSSGFYFLVLDELLISHLKLLRVLDIECAGYCSRTCNINMFAILVHLRYFALTYQSIIIHAPHYIKLFEHKNMQSFIVRGRYVSWDSSSASTIWTMPLLRNCCVEKLLSLGTSPVVHTNLENISWLDPKLCTQDLFTRIPNIKKLGIEGGDAKSPDCFYNFVHLRQLEELSIRKWWNLSHIPCSGIPWATSFLPNLKKLKFFGTRLPWSDMRLIGMLPNLEVLKLIDACQGPKWETSEAGFRQLKRLVIKDRSLEDWNAEGDHFPMLECLELHECTDLQKIPSGFVDITTLALIELNYCEDLLLTSAKQAVAPQQSPLALCVFAPLQTRRQQSLPLSHSGDSAPAGSRLYRSTTPLLDIWTIDRLIHRSPAPQSLPISESLHRNSQVATQRLHRGQRPRRQSLLLPPQYSCLHRPSTTTIPPPAMKRYVRPPISSQSQKNAMLSSELSCQKRRRRNVKLGICREGKECTEEMRLIWKEFCSESDRHTQMAYAAVTSLMETLSLNFLQSEPPFPLEDLEAQIRGYVNENLGLLQQILEDMAMKDVEVELEESSSKGWTKRLPRPHGIFNNKAVKQSDYPKKKKKLIKSENAWDSIPLTSRLREVAEVKQKMVSLHQNLGLLQDIILQKSEIFANDEIKDLEAQIRDVFFQAEERIEMELSAIYLAKDSRLHITASLLRLHEIFIEAEKQTEYLKNELMIRLAKASSQIETITDDVSLLGRIRRRGLLLVKGGGSSQSDLPHKNIILEKLSIKRIMDLQLTSRSIQWSTSFLPNLKKLKFLNSYLEWNDLSLISMLPNLEVLKLIDACIGVKWETNDGGFRRLKRLVIADTILQYWNAVGDHFPMLEYLELSFCRWLEKIPRGFADITTLALIQLSECRVSLVASAEWIQNEQNNYYGNNALLIRSENTLVSFYPSDLSVTI
nr:putative late blight resistance protein homolog R1B-16 isoform X1 [Ipomoea batatas]